MSIETSVENGDKEQLKIETDLAIQFTEIFLKKQDNITVLLGLLEVGRINSCFIGYELVSHQISFSLAK